MTTASASGPPPTVRPIVLPEPEWRARQQAHRARVRPWTEAYRARAARGERHPVHDFLWEYYSLRPAQLERWHPGFGVVLAGDGAAAVRDRPGYGETDEGIGCTLEACVANRVAAVRWSSPAVRGTPTG